MGAKHAEPLAVGGGRGHGVAGCAVGIIAGVLTYSLPALATGFAGDMTQLLILRCLTALEAVLRRNGFRLPAGAAVDAACKVYDEADS